MYQTKSFISAPMGESLVASPMMYDGSFEIQYENPYGIGSNFGYVPTEVYLNNGKAVPWSNMEKSWNPQTRAVNQSGFDPVKVSPMEDAYGVAYDEAAMLQGK